METPPDSDDFDREAHERIMARLRPFFHITDDERRRCKLILDARLRRQGDHLHADGLWRPDDAHPTMPGFVSSAAFSEREICLAQTPGDSGYTWHVDPDGLGWIRRTF